jgi:hypothetical protein
MSERSELIRVTASLFAAQRRMLTGAPLVAQMQAPENEWTEHQ